MKLTKGAKFAGFVAAAIFAIQAEAAIVILGNASGVYADGQAHDGIAPLDNYMDGMDFPGETGIPATYGGAASGSALSGSDSAGSTASLGVLVEQFGNYTGFNLRPNSDANASSSFDTWSNANAIVDIVFSVDGPYQYGFGVELAGATGSATLSGALIELGSANTLFEFTIVNDFAYPWFTGMIGEGEYQLLLQASSWADSGSSSGLAMADAYFSLTEVPLPAALPLMLAGLGLFGFGFVRRRS